MKKSKSLILVLTGAMLLFGSMQGFSASKYLSMSRYYQHKTQWCWAAVSQTIRKYNKNFYRWQCKMAAALVANSTNEYCCGTNGYYESSIAYPAGSTQNARCNQPYYMDSAMYWNGIYGGTFTGLLATSTIITEINALRPFAIGILWDAGGGHALMVHGYNTTATPDKFYLWDPTLGAQYLTRAGIEDYRGTSYCGYSFKSTR